MSELVTLLQQALLVATCRVIVTSSSSFPKLAKALESETTLEKTQQKIHQICLVTLLLIAFLRQVVFEPFAFRASL